MNGRGSNSAGGPLAAPGTGRDRAGDGGWAEILRSAMPPAVALAVAWIGLTVLLGAFDVWSLTAHGTGKDYLEFAVGGCLIAASVGLFASVARRAGRLMARAPAATRPSSERWSPRG